MFVIMHHSATEEQIRAVVEAIELMGYTANVIPGLTRVAIAVTGNRDPVDRNVIESLSGVYQAVHVVKQFKLVSRENKSENTIIDVHGTLVGGKELTIIAGPCSVESREQILDAAEKAKASGAHMLRGGAFKPRTSPYSFQGIGEQGLKLLAEARKLTGLPVVSEVIDVESVILAEPYLDILQIGARNMQNYSLLKKAARSKKPILLKRGASATLEELLNAAEYILAEGNDKVILCERGIRGFSDFSRNTLDLSIIPAIKELSHLPVITDPSHGTGRRILVAPLARASIAAGADGVIVEMHPDPDHAISDGFQSLHPFQLDSLIHELALIAPIVGRTISTRAT